MTTQQQKVQHHTGQRETGQPDERSMLVKKTLLEEHQHRQTLQHFNHIDDFWFESPCPLADDNVEKCHFHLCPATVDSNIPHWQREHDHFSHEKEVRENCLISILTLHIRIAKEPM